ncbi:GTPase HflX, partial [Staphylococcus cohnii]
LLHVVDASHPEYRVQYDTVNQIIGDLDMGHIPQAIIFNKKDLHKGTVPTTNLPSIFVSSKNEADEEKVKQLLIEQVKSALTTYEENVPSADADRLYFLKQHTLVTEIKFNETDATYTVKGFKKE